MYNRIIIYPLFILIVLCYAFIGCNSDSSKVEIPGNTEKNANGQMLFDKIAGTWQNANGKSFERWTKNNDGTYEVSGFNVKASDTIQTEKAHIYQENGNWIFENTVQGQNQGKAIKFVASILSGNQVQFSNPAHDFPTDIHYKLTNATTLDAFIVGPNNKGGKDTIPFYFKKMK